MTKRIKTTNPKIRLVRPGDPQDPGVSKEAFARALDAEPLGAITRRPRDVAFRPERVFVTPKIGSRVDCPETATDPTDGVVVSCAFEKGHEHPCRFIRITGVEHRCGLCGETFKIDKSDPHWSTGRGPFCPKPRLAP